MYADTGWPDDLGPAKRRCSTCGVDKTQSDYSLQTKLYGEDTFLSGSKRKCDSCRLEKRTPSSLALQSDTEWMADGACVGEAPALFFAPNGSVDAFKAGQICQGCPVKALCGPWAASTGQSGVWGGKYLPDPLVSPRGDLRHGAPQRIRDPFAGRPDARRFTPGVSIMDMGVCRAGKHPIRYEEDVVIQKKKGVPFYSCKVCFLAARERYSKTKREKARAAGALPKRKLQVGDRCRHHHLITEETIYRNPNGGTQCRICRRGAQKSHDEQRVDKNHAAAAAQSVAEGDATVHALAR